MGSNDGNRQKLATWLMGVEARGVGQMKVFKHRIQVADLTDAAVSQAFAMSGVVPALHAIMGAALLVTTTPAGGGAASVTITVGDSIGRTYVDLQQIIAAAPGAFVQLLNSNPDGIDGATNFSLHTVDRTLAMSIEADVDVNTLTACDVTAYIFYVDAGVTAP